MSSKHTTVAKGMYKYVKRNMQSSID